MAYGLFGQRRNMDPGFTRSPDTKTTAMNNYLNRRNGGTLVNYAPGINLGIYDQHMPAAMSAYNQQQAERAARGPYQLLASRVPTGPIPRSGMNFFGGLGGAATRIAPQAGRVMSGTPGFATGMAGAAGQPSVLGGVASGMAGAARSPQFYRGAMQGIGGAIPPTAAVPPSTRNML